MGLGVAFNQSFSDTGSNLAVKDLQFSQRSNNRKFILVSLILFLPSLLFYLPLSQTRLVGGDEGYYGLAAKLVLQGETPYIDFFYPQMPMLPYLLAGWGKIFGFGWESLRGMFAVFCAIGASLVSYLVAKRTNSYLFGFLGIALYLTSDLITGYLLVIKAYCVPVTLLLFAVALIDESSSKRKAFFAALCSVVAASIRLYFVLVIPILAWKLWVNSKEETWSRIKILSWFFVGAIIGAAPTIFIFAKDPELFIFNNLTYHGLRNPIGLFGDIQKKLQVPQSMLGYAGQVGEISPQLFFLTSLSFLYLFYCWNGLKNISLPFLSGAVLFCVSFLPTPIYLQYFVVTVPFFIICSSELIAALVKKREDFKNAAFGLAGIIVILYVALYPREMERYIENGHNVPGVFTSKKVEFFKIGFLRKVSDEIDRLSEKGEFVLSSWPGYLLDTEAQVFPKMENHFGIKIAKKLTLKQQERYHIISQEDLKDAIQKRSARLVILGYRGDKKIYAPILKESGYRLVKRIGNVLFFLLEP